MQAQEAFGTPFWNNGPAPGAFYNFPGNQAASEYAKEIVNPTPFGSQRASQPITTGTSVIGLKFKDGIIIAADNLISYGSTARFPDVDRVFQVNRNVMIGIGGDYADFQFIKRYIDQLVINDQSLNDKNELKPKALYTYLTRVLYNRRSRFNPLWLDIIVGGIQDDKPFLGHINVRGRSYTADCVGTGFGNHLAVPLMREVTERGVDLERDRALKVVHRCMEVLFYRDCRAYPNYSMGIVATGEDAQVTRSHSVAQNWELAHLIKGY